MKSNREFDYFGNVLKYQYDYFALYSSTFTQKVPVLEYEYDYSISAEHQKKIDTYGFHESHLYVRNKIFIKVIMKVIMITF